jgi:predicted acyltransferase
MRQRLVCLDVLRGATVALMILVNNHGSWAHVPAPLRHAEWNGCTPTDLVFPFFLFIVGGAMALSLAPARAAGAPRGPLMKKVVRRGVLIILLGLALNLFPAGLPLDPTAVREFKPYFVTSAVEHLRLPGVLQRIGACWLIAASLIVLVPQTRRRIAIAAGLLIAYEAAMRLPLVPGWGAGSFGPTDNFAHWIDLHVLGAVHLLSGAQNTDPEGLLPNLSATLGTLLGFASVSWLTKGPMVTSRLAKLLGVGAALAVLALLLRPLEPINKHLWTPTYVMFTGGLAMVFLAFFAWTIDVRGWRAGLRPFEAYGFNPLLVFWGSGLLARLLSHSRWSIGDANPVSLSTLIYRNFYASWAGPMTGSVLFAVGMVLFWLAVSWVLYRRGWAWRV